MFRPRTALLSHDPGHVVLINTSFYIRLQYNVSYVHETLLSGNLVPSSDFALQFSLWPYRSCPRWRVDKS